MQKLDAAAPGDAVYANAQAFGKAARWVFLSLEQVTALYRLSLQGDGGKDGLRDPSAFESAVSHPQYI